jgi:AbrB family looped-hinge helix DNA binding protein
VVATIRGFVRVDAEGRVSIPENIRRQAGLKPGQLVELKVMGAGKKSMLVTAREAAR